MRQCGLEKFQWHLMSGAGARSPATTAFFSMADSAVSKQSRPERAASKKRRQATVSTETEKKLARAARSAQRLAQLSDVSRDDSTLDLFPDDPTRATLEAMNIDIRQGTLHGFELPDVVLAAVGALDTAAEGASVDAKAGRRAPRAARTDEPIAVHAQLSGLETEPPLADGSGAPQASSAVDLAVADKGAIPPLTPAMAAATVARSVTALRQAAERSAAGTDAAVGIGSRDGGMVVEPAAVSGRAEAAEAAGAGVSRSGGMQASATSPGSEFAALDLERTSAREMASSAGMGAAEAPLAGTNAGVRPAASLTATGTQAHGTRASAGMDAQTRGTAPFASTDTGAGSTAPSEGMDAQTRGTVPSAATRTEARGTASSANPHASVHQATRSTNSSAAAPENNRSANAPSPAHDTASNISDASGRAAAGFVPPLHEARRAEAASPTAPELDRARATAFADTVDALYGVIADQRRAATDHSRRMKWMLSIVVGALLMTVAIGITQTVLLMRLTRETTAQQHRVEQMMQNQQAAMASLLDTQMAMANAAAAQAASPAVTPESATPQHTAAASASANGKRAVHAQRAHKQKTATVR